MMASDLAQLMLENGALMPWPGLADLRLAGHVGPGPEGLKTWRRACELAQAAQVAGRIGVVAGAIKAQASAAAALQSLIELVEAQAEQLEQSHRRETSLRTDVIHLERERTGAWARVAELEAELQAARAGR